MTRTLIDKERNIFKDDFGRSICVENKDFWQYCKKKNITLAEIQRLSMAKKREFFLHWKHGLTDPHVNEEIESSEWASYGSEMNTPEDKLDPYFKERIIAWRNFEKYCLSIKQQIGLAPGGHPEPINMTRTVPADRNWQD